MHTLTRRQLLALVLLTLVWGFNWPVMKLGVSDFPALSFRSLCMWLGLPLLLGVLWWQRIPFRVPRAHWPALLVLAVFNMLIWHSLTIVAIQWLSSGRTAILGYSMPIFSALIGAAWFGQRLPRRAWAGIAAAALAVLLLLWHEFTQLAGQPVGVLMMLVAASTWALGTQLLRHTRIPCATLTLAFWMTVLTAIWTSALATGLERSAWHWPSPSVWGAIAYNAVGVFAFAQVVWLSMARDLPPVASTLSIMLIPVLGVFSGAYWLNEILHWQDWTAVLLVVLAIGSVLWPSRAQAT